MLHESVGQLVSTCSKAVGNAVMLKLHCPKVRHPVQAAIESEYSISNGLDN